MEAGKVVELSPLVRRITAGNGSVFTGPGTNTYLVGKEEVTVIDPGPAMQEHIDVITAAAPNIKQILVTHTHPDHSPGVRLLKENLDIPAYGMLTNSSKNQDQTFSPERILDDGEVFQEEEFSIEVVHTPGHASNHLCFILKEEKLIFTGDHIMNGSTVVIGPPDGNMKQYIQSLEKLKDYDIEKIAPGHGELLENPHEVADWIINHRLEREKKVFQALQEATKGTPDTLVEKVYDDVDSSLFPIAKASLLAHLIKLEEDQLIYSSGEEYFIENTN
ncbi:MBL fold metallo-hydrolase [Gammaproteobacteria bacterium]|jgi:glyoxylase-like metal-dependent hydrolase (beta-lactamase superfamily II)|nr:MBL fold metallo-hydrolase [Candidatus Neomarinimicrobiota bacterium]MDA9736719.1 MBL fold metallo-hydrolase [Gammaproteobacteria bacterium]MEC8314737.1 MBL fold metallo-hydrolase [Pseudomonadota bacterium]MEC8448715.1 MBL fold metallo-hydrolase [Pseudomonadota bacterium]MEC8797945.1 MBL fold metallo-hydrolase [Pseudomonadota bacterium]|tara:strand:+ start:96 stop:923 length:828 start_codon:yes stop_codon:yes gene_type:complete